MFEVNEDYIISVTRGDAGAFTFTAKNEDGSPFVFEAGSRVRFSVFEKKNATNVVLQKDTIVRENATEVQISLTESETRNISKESISKPVDYWYEVVLDPFHNPQTLLGYDDDGAKVLRLYPEAEELPEEEINEEDIPVVDKELDTSSNRPIENRAVAVEFLKLSSKIKYLTPEMYGAVGDGVADDSGAINAMLADEKNAHLPILLSGKKYGCKYPIVDRIGHTMLPNSAEIVALEGIVADGWLFSVDIDKPRAKQGVFSYHINLDCEGLGNGLYIKGSIGNKYDIVIKNATEGLCINRGVYNDVYENEIDVRVDAETGVGVIGLSIDGNDNMFGNVVVVNYSTAILNDGNSHFKYVHCWLDRNGASAWENSVLLDDITNTCGATIDYLYADTYKCGVRCVNNASVHIGTYYALINDAEMIEGGVSVLESKHIVFEGEGSVVIDMFETNQSADYLNIIPTFYKKPNITIKEAKCPDFVQSAKIDQLIFPCSITSSDVAFANVPSALQGSQGVVLLTPIHMSGTRGMIARRNVTAGGNYNKIFVNYEGAISENSWKYLTLT